MFELALQAAKDGERAELVPIFEEFLNRLLRSEKK